MAFELSIFRGWFESVPDEVVALLWFIPVVLWIWWLYTHEEVKRRRHVLHAAPMISLAVFVIGGGVLGASAGALGWWSLKKQHEHQQAGKLPASLPPHEVESGSQPQLQGRFNKIVLGEGSIAKSSGEEQESAIIMLALVELHNTGKIQSIAEDFRLSAKLHNGISIPKLYPELTKDRRWNFTSAFTGAEIATIEKSWLYDKTTTPISPGHIVCGWLLFILPGINFDDLKGHTCSAPR